MTFEKTDVWGFEHAIRGMRNPLESWSKSDTTSACFYADIKTCGVTIGENDLELMQKLIKAGSEHRKFIRQIMVSVDITAPLYWWKEFDTYKVGTVANSTSTMHKLASTPITIDCFEMGDFVDIDIEVNDLVYSNLNSWNTLIAECEYLRKKYLETKDKRYWKELIRLLPESWLQKRTVTMNYENLLNICSVGQRKNHKLSEWSVDFISWARSLPYAQQLIFINEVEIDTRRNSTN